MFNAVWLEEEVVVVEEVSRKVLLRYVGGGQRGDEVGRRVSTEQDSNADNSDRYSPGTP